MITLLNRFDDKYVIKKEDILEITSKYTRDNNLRTYLSDVVFSNEESSYDPESQIINFNIDAIEESNRRLFERLRDTHQIDEAYTSYYLNFYYLQTIYHLLTHVSQKANYQDREDLVGYLYDLNSRLHVDPKTGLLLPMEIEANNTGILTASKLLRCTKLPGKESTVMDLEYLKSLLLNYQRRNNYQVTSPVEVLSSTFPIVDIDKINELLDQSKLSKTDRFNLGLPVTTKEYDEVAKKLVKSKHN